MCNGNDLPQDSQPMQTGAENRLMKGIVNGLAIMLPVYTLMGGLYVWFTHR